jgi:cytochrome c-type biogenesis protein CcmH/NrfG
MATWSPPSLPQRWLVAAAVLFVFLFGYSVLVIGQVLLGILPGIVLAVLYVSWRLLAAVEAIAEAQQRSADARERMADQRE